MKKKIFGTALIAAMALAAGWNYQQNKQSVKLSNLAMANVTALASGENGNKIYCCGNYGTCMKVIDSQGKLHDVADIKFTSPCP